MDTEVFQGEPGRDAEICRDGDGPGSTRVRFCAGCGEGGRRRADIGGNTWREDVAAVVGGTSGAREDGGSGGRVDARRGVRGRDAGL